MKPEMRKIIDELTKKYGKIKPCSIAGTWDKSITKSIHNDELLLWFNTSDDSSHLVRIKDWKIKT